MHKRLIVAFVALAVGIIALYGVPRIFAGYDTVQESEGLYTTRLVEVIGVAITERGTAPDAEFLAPLIDDGEGLHYVDASGADVQVGAVADDDDVSATVELADGASVTFTRSDALVSSRVSARIMPVVLIGLVLLFISVLVAVLLARALSRPFVQLVDTAREIGEGRTDPAPTRLTTPEARALDAALRTSAAQLSRRIRREHEFAANASHQLRTPITAVRLELEDLSLWPETPPVVREQLGHAVREIDRLAQAITQLLELARGDAPGAHTAEPLGEVMRSAAARWLAPAQARGRSIRIDDPVSDLGSAPSAASQILDVLLHNALEHGAGDVTIRGARHAEYVTVQVSDEGARPQGNAIFQRRPEQRSSTSGEGIGLALSAELAESLGGHLLLDGSETTTFTLMLPVRD